MLTKDELDQKVALSLGMPVARVAEVTDEFVDELCNALTNNGGFSIPTLGKLVAKIEKSGGGSAAVNDPSRSATRIKLYFTKSKILKRQIERKLEVKESHVRRDDQVRR